ncbi:MAG: hypothetical protein M1832_005376 [Thelocarpon impressellum]|nr:MAG: hypothetical protein M1832_005376 [Thelocarpon impressellum]
MTVVLARRKAFFLIARNWAKASFFASEPLELAEEPDFEPLSGRCAYWTGIAEHNLGAVVNAADWFRIAQNAAGRYPGGEQAKFPPNWKACDG